MATSRADHRYDSSVRVRSLRRSGTPSPQFIRTVGKGMSGILSTQAPLVSNVDGRICVGASSVLMGAIRALVCDVTAKVEGTTNRYPCEVCHGVDRQLFVQVSG